MENGERPQVPIETRVKETIDAIGEYLNNLLTEKNPIIAGYSDDNVLKAGFFNITTPITGNDVITCVLVITINGIRREFKKDITDIHSEDVITLQFKSNKTGQPFTVYMLKGMILEVAVLLMEEIAVKYEINPKL